MHELSKCLLTPHFFLPMEIASVMLLATASVVLLCTVVKCCCRHFCMPLPSPSEHASASSIDLGELSDGSDDESAPRVTITTTAHGRNAAGGNGAPSGAAARARDEAHAAKAVAHVEVDEDEELPAYTHVSS